MLAKYMLWLHWHALLTCLVVADVVLLLLLPIQLFWDFADEQCHCDNGS
jgi:hypothetical protein